MTNNSQPSHFSVSTPAKMKIHFLTQEAPPATVVFLADSPSALPALTASSVEKPLNTLQGTLRKLSMKSATVLQWIPAHCGTAGNERADRLAKEGGGRRQHKPSLTHQQAKTLIKSRWTSTFKRRLAVTRPPATPCITSATQRRQPSSSSERGHCGLKAHL